MRLQARPPLSRTATRRRRLSAVAWLVTAMRLLVLTVAVQCTGVIHFTDDFADALDGAAHVDEDCSSEDDPSHDCPPGCPSCHGASGFLRALPPDVHDAAVELLAPEVDVVKPWFVELGAPRQTHRLSVYRPPRLTNLAS
jgi:hypothetical protein